MNEDHKTARIVIFGILTIVLASLLFAYKVEYCKSTPANCKDEFHEVKTDIRSTYTCEPGAVAEFVNSPPAPRPGILCHCTTTGIQVQPK